MVAWAVWLCKFRHVCIQISITIAVVVPDSRHLAAVRPVVVHPGHVYPICIFCFPVPDSRPRGVGLSSNTYIHPADHMDHYWSVLHLLFFFFCSNTSFQHTILPPNVVYCRLTSHIFAYSHLLFPV